ncbi:MAG: hypothetical protein ACRCZE_04520, partial [Candidatus Altimarinota bacterium]
MADQTPQKDPKNQVLNNTLFLEKHEEKGPEKVLTPEEKAVEGLEFEGEGVPEPSWLKNLNEESSAAQKFAENKGKVDKKDEAILQSTEKPLVAAPNAGEVAKPVEVKKEEIPAQLVKKTELSGQKPAEKPVEIVKTAAEEMTAEEKKKSEQKVNVLQNVNKGLAGFFSKSKEEIEKAKSAGVEEAGRTLENYDKTPVELALEKTPAGQAKKQSQEAERKALTEAEKIYQEGMATVRDLIAPSSMDIQYDHLRVEGMYARSFIVYSYPRYLDTNWLSPVINLDVTMDIAQFIYPIESSKIMKILTKKVTQMQSAMSMNAEKGLVRDPGLETAYEDAESLRTEIQRGQEKFFQFSMYITLYSEDLKKIDQVTKQLESILGSKLILT